MARTREDPLSQRKRAAILAAAAAAFREEGVQNASMDRIAERAGVSKRTVYGHFESKDALFDVVIATAWERLVPLAEEPPRATLPVGARLRAFARSRLAVLLDPEVLALFRVVFAESVRAPELRRAYRMGDGHLEPLGAREFLRDEVARGRLRIDDLEIASSQFWGLLFEHTFWPAVLGMRPTTDAAERERAIEEGVATFLSRYGVRKRPRRPAAR